jgi:hypothetical protein
MDLIVTGLPRSGLTLVAALIDYLPNSVCLNAPDWQLAQARKMSGQTAAFSGFLIKRRSATTAWKTACR